MLTTRRMFSAVLLITLFYATSVLWATIVDDALNLPGLEEIKQAVRDGKIKITLKKIPPVTDPNGVVHGVAGYRSGNDIVLNSDVFNGSTDSGVVAQTIVHEYWHWKLSHKANAKESELAVRKKEAEFWKQYKAAHPGVSDRECDLNEILVYENGQFRADKVIEGLINSAYGYPDDPDGKQESNCVYDVDCSSPPSCTLSKNSCQSSLELSGPHIVTPSSASATVTVGPPDANNISSLIVTQYDAEAPSVSVAGYGSTGTNLVSLDTSRTSFGFVDRNTNKVVIYLYSSITNRLYNSTNPILVRTHAQGSYNPSTHQLHLTTIAVDDIPLPNISIPGTSLRWLLLTALVLGIGATLAFLRARRALSYPNSTPLT